MRVKSYSLKTNKSGLQVIKGAIGALVISLIAILIFAFIIKFTGLADSFIKQINQVIKIVSIFFGNVVMLKKVDEKKIGNGILVGILYTIIAFLLFSLLNGSFDFNLTLLIDILFGGLIGLISTVICNIFSKR